MNLKRIISYAPALACCLLLIQACKKDERESSVASEPVDFYLYLNEPANVDLNAIGGWKYLNAGTKGIIIYRVSTDDFTALERNCPYDPDKNCSLIEVTSVPIAVDSCCGSKFSIVDGALINGPASQPMYRYQVVKNGDVLHVYH